MTRAKRCAVCGHPKSHHLVSRCKRQTSRWDGGPSGPKYLIVRDCPRQGWEPKAADA